MEDKYHIPVLYQEVIDNLVINKDGIYLDCTLGGGGHSEGILNNLTENGKLVAIDQDESAINFAKKRLERFGDKVQVYKDNFKNLDVILYMAGFDKVDGILMDIGVSSEQFDNPERGFSYRFEADLDMRMNKSQKLTAYEVINTYTEEELARVIYEYGEERASRKIAKYIVEKRKTNPIKTTIDLVNIIRKAKPKKTKKHPAKQTFQAIRIEVNKELEVLNDAIEKSLKMLKSGGRLAIITFHSLEDRLVKQKFRELATGCTCPPECPICICGKKPVVKLITRKPIIPTNNEVVDNKRSHSSKLRIIERL